MPRLHANGDEMTLDELQAVRFDARRPAFMARRAAALAAQKVYPVLWAPGEHDRILAEQYAADRAAGRSWPGEAARGLLFDASGENVIGVDVWPGDREPKYAGSW